MKINLQPSQNSQLKRHLAAATLVEAMFASVILVMVMAALMAAHFMGLRQYQLVDTKSGASDASRRVLNQLPVEIRSSKTWTIGNMNNGIFSNVGNGSAQQGTALKLFLTTNNSTPYIQYYFDLSGSNNSNGKLMRFTSDNTNAVCLASNLVNWLGGGYSFSGEDYRGVLATNMSNGKTYKSVIHTTLQFCQFEYPLTLVGTNGLYDYYKIEFRATPHLPE